MVVLSLSGPADNPEIVARRDLTLAEIILEAIDEMGQDIRSGIARVECEMANAARAKGGRFVL